MKKPLLSFVLCCFAIQAFTQVHFTNASFANGIIHQYQGILGGGVSFVDFDNDGMDDLTLATGMGEAIDFYRNNGTTFSKLPPLVNLQVQTKQILWVDFDNDGDYDLYVTNYGSANRLYENKGTLIFEDITESAGLPLLENNTYGACFGDIDRDGWLDLYYNDRVPFNTQNNRHYLFRNNADGTFTDITESSQTKDGGKVPFCSAFIDYNNDRWPDIYTAHDKMAIPNVLLENNSDGTFTDVSIPSNADVSMDAMCVNPGDYNNDGWIDIYITNTPQMGSALLQNIGPGGGGQVKFGNAALFAGVTFPERTGWGSVFFDADNDRDLDLYVTAANYGNIAQSNTFYLNNGNNTFSQPDAGFEGDTTITYNTAVGDVNADGYPDIIVINQEPHHTQLWKNNGGDNHWIKIKLQGVLSNRDGIGAKLETHSGGQYQMRYVLCGNGFLGQNSLTENIGLNTSESADSIVITWPTGHVDRLYDVPSGETMTIIEGSTTNGNIAVDDDVTLTLPPPNSVQEEDTSLFSIYPNPAANTLHIYNNDLLINNYHYYLLDTNGRVINSYQTGYQHTTLDVSNYHPGIYYIMAVDEKGIKFIEKWIKI